MYEFFFFFFFFLSHRTIVVPSSNQKFPLGSSLVGYHEDRPNAQHVQVSGYLAVWTFGWAVLPRIFVSELAVFDCFSPV